MWVTYWNCVTLTVLPGQEIWFLGIWGKSPRQRRHLSKRMRLPLGRFALKQIDSQSLCICFTLRQVDLHTGQDVALMTTYGYVWHSWPLMVIYHNHGQGEGVDIYLDNGNVNHFALVLRILCPWLQCPRLMSTMSSFKVAFSSFD